MRVDDDFRRAIGNVLERGMNAANESDKQRHNRLLDNERTRLKRLTKRARRLQVLGFSRKGIASKLGVTEDDVWELLKETSE